MDKLNHLLSPITIRGKVFPNRIVAAPAINGAVTVEGLPKTKGFRSFVQKAAGGCGAVAVGEVDVDPDYGNVTDFPPVGDFKNPIGPQFEGWKAHALAIQQYGAVALVELCHAGILRLPSAGGMPGALGPVERDMITFSGAVEHVHQMDQALMAEVSNNFAICADYMKRAGFDGVVVRPMVGCFISSYPRLPTRERMSLAETWKTAVSFRFKWCAAFVRW